MKKKDISGSEPNDISAALGLDSPKGRGGFKKVMFFLVSGLLLLIAWYFLGGRLDPGASQIQYITKKVTRGDLTITVSATGNLEPTNQVELGSELSGTIHTVEVDYNDLVKVGQVLARLEDSKFRAEVMRCQASLASARANLKDTQATVKEKRGDLIRLKQVRSLSNNKAVSKSDLDAAEAALERAVAAQEKAQAEILVAEASLNTAEADLVKTNIVSPINGVVLSRDVEPGQTVAASLQAVELFTLAEDLSRMELHVDVDEADVGQVRTGQKALFTVDTYPERQYPASITQVRYGANSEDGVVTYETVLKVDNADLSLLPGMTATADIILKEVKKALLVPNAALRYTPPESHPAGPPPMKNEGGLLQSLLPHPPGPPQREKNNTPSGPSPGGPDKKVWILKQGRVFPVRVETGATDGSMTEVSGGDLLPGMEVIVENASPGQ